MKRKLTPFITTVLNTASAAINASSGLFQELQLPKGETELRFRLTPYGEFPAKDINGKDVIQVVDQSTAHTLAANYKTLIGKLATFGGGVPIYEGHADDPGWSAKNPGHKAIAVGRIKSFEAGDDGVYVTAVLNTAGVELLGGEAPRYSGHSPHWRLTEVPGRSKHFKPVLLWSTALTNTPNIPGNSIALNATEGVDMEEVDKELEHSPAAGPSGESEQPETNNNENMKLTPEALKALGFAPDAEPSAEEISAAIIKVHSDKAEAEADKATAEGETTAANTRADNLQTELDSLRGENVTDAVNAAVTDGRIPEADREKWTNALNASFDSEKAKLDALVPTVNTEKKVDTNGDKRAPAVTDVANAAASITEGVRAYAKEEGIDISTAKGWDEAYGKCRSAKPELFGQG